MEPIVVDVDAWSSGGDEVMFVSERRVQSEVVFVSEKGPMASCGICFDEEENLHRLGTCRHGYCTECLAHYLCGIATETKKFPVPCPGCAADKNNSNDGKLDPWRCADVLRQAGDEKAADTLMQLAVEKTAVDSVKYCSNAACATPFDYAGTHSRDQARIICPLCKVATCVLCSRPWHEGVCEPSEEQLALVNDKKHQQCPKCKELVYRTEGCDHMTCRCGAHFCFKCGGNLGGYHGGSHGCKCTMH